MTVRLRMERYIESVGGQNSEKEGKHINEVNNLCEENQALKDNN